MKFWFEKLICIFCHRFHSWKKNSNQLFSPKFQCRIKQLLLNFPPIIFFPGQLGIWDTFLSKIHQSYIEKISWESLRVSGSCLSISWLRFRLLEKWWFLTLSNQCTLKFRHYQNPQENTFSTRRNLLILELGPGQPMLACSRPLGPIYW